MPYLALFPAFLKLRKVDADLERPYRVPGGSSLATIMAVVCEVFICRPSCSSYGCPASPWIGPTPCR